MDKIEIAIRYVTFDETGALTGCYLQVPPDDHLPHMIQVSDSIVGDWTRYRANDKRDSIVLAPTIPATTPTTIPQVVTMRQARLALLKIGKLDNVDEAIASLQSPQKEEAKIEWDYSSTVERSRNIVGLLAAALNMTEKELDDLFVTASSL